MQMDSFYVPSCIDYRDRKVARGNTSRTIEVDMYLV